MHIRNFSAIFGVAYLPFNTTYMTKTNRELLYGTLAALFFAILAICAIVFGLSGCKTTKVAKATHDSIIYKVRDSVVVKNHLRYKDSTIIKDTLVRVKYDRAEWRFPANSTKDTAIRSGRATLRISVNNGQVTGQADCDSFDILFQDMRIVISQKETENELLSKQFQDYKQSHTELTVKTESKGWFGRMWDKCRNTLAWVGLLAVVYLIWKIYKRGATG